MNNLFDNPMVRAARAGMSQQTIDEYKRMGEEMYNTVDFDNCAILNNPDQPLIESVAYILEALKSGMDISYLTEDEVNVLKTRYGDDWINKIKIE